MKINRALISVSDKTELIPLVEILVRHGVEIVSTGGTAKYLQDHRIPVKLLSTVTGFPEIMDGRVKTLHPRIFGGILAVRENETHQKEMADHGIEPIDLVVVNLYPFEEQAVKRNLSIEDSTEWIDIGGPSLIRASAKNHSSVAVLVDPLDYRKVAEELDRNSGILSLETRRHLAVKAFQYTSHYDACIASYFLRKLSVSEFPSYFPLPLKLALPLRYGENPHQRGALYISTTVPGGSLSRAEKIQGKELSYNNLLDFDAAFALSCALKQTSAVIIKHNNPCGVAVDADVAVAYRKARAADPIAAFGGIVSINGTIDEEAAKVIIETFIEGILAREFTAEALLVFSNRPNIRVLRLPMEWQIEDTFDMKKITGGALIQDRDTKEFLREQAKVVTRRAPTEEEWKALEFAWIVCEFVKSNAIVFAHSDVTVGIGAGQMSRVDSVKIAKMKAQHSLRGTCVASDAFFPFRDGIDEIAEAGATAVIQPGGSIRDQEVIDAANEHNIAMVFTGIRHFRH